QEDRATWHRVRTRGDHNNTPLGDGGGIEEGSLMRAARGLRPDFRSIPPHHRAAPPWSTVLRGAGVASVVACLLTTLLSPDAAASNVRVPRTFFGLHDKSMQVYSRVPFGSLRLWDAGVTWRDVETSPGTY